MFVSGGDPGWRWVARERAPPKAGAHFTPRTRSDTTLNFELKFARGHASHTPLAANSPYSLCLGVSRAWATRGASHHPYGSRYGAVHATAALIASGVARVRGGASAEPPRRTRATPPPCRPGWGRHIPAPRKHIALRREQTFSGTRDAREVVVTYPSGMSSGWAGAGISGRELPGEAVHRWMATHGSPTRR